MDTATHSFLTDVLHAFAQSLLTPDIILLLAFVGYALFSIGSVLVEYFTERRNFKVAMPKFLAALMAAEEDEIPAVIAESGLLNRQKTALLTVFDYRTLPGDALLALIRRTVNTEETRYDKITGRNNVAAKVAPMLGLMGTLIPLGPGIEALGRADTSALSQSLLIAFDTTVTGLIVAAICLAIGKIRSNWYNDYLSALDSGMATMLQKIDDLRAAGKITTEKPTDYAFMFEEGLKNGTKQEKEEAKQDAASAETAAATPSESDIRPADSATPHGTSALSPNPFSMPTDSRVSRAAAPRTGASNTGDDAPTTRPYTSNFAPAATPAATPTPRTSTVPTGTQPTAGSFATPAAPASRPTVTPAAPAAPAAPTTPTTPTTPTSSPSISAPTTQRPGEPQE